ncbi:MAG: lysophospholipid acyltransferase family protein [Candidatus Gastranaerophilaceae bacterium]
MIDIENTKQIDFISNLVYRLFKVLEKMIEIRNINYPTQNKKVIFAMWHSDECCIHGIPNEQRDKVGVLISKSVDGEIIARVVKKLGYSLIRGSQDKGTQNKGGVKATMEMIEWLNEDKNVAIMIDGPVGPLHRVKNGVIKVAKHTGAVIIPVVWYSPNLSFLKLPTWDKFKFPIWFTKIVNLYGDPIYVPEECSTEQEQDIKEQLRQALFSLEKKAPEAFKEAYKKKKK